MNRIFFVVLALSLCIIAPCQETPNVGSNTAGRLLFVAEKTVDAIKEQNTTFLISIADRDGVWIGTDTEKMSTAQFERDLSQKQGVYCVLLDGTCYKSAGGANSSNDDASLHGILSHESTTMSVSSVAGQSHVKAVSIKAASNPNRLFCTLIFRLVNSHWMLQQIEYD